MVLNRHHTTDFPYPALPPKEDAIRILTIEPGDFDDEVTATLAPATFGSKPKCTALSYTWGDPHPDNAALPTAPCREDTAKGPTGINTPESSSQVLELTSSNEGSFIIVNSFHFPVKRNLALALRHLRSPKHPRAFMVVAWLGVGDFQGSVDPFRYMRREWISGQTQYLAAYVGGSEKACFSPKPVEPTTTRIATSSYWTRLWIVQEVCLSHQLAIAVGPKIWTCEDFRGWAPVKTAMVKPSRPGDHWDPESLSRLFTTRASRHSEEMSLINLVRNFSTATSSDVRDKIYGLLGLANDVTPYSGANGDVDPIDQYIKLLDPYNELAPKLPGGKGMLKVDYSQPVYEVWAEVMKYVYFRAKRVGGEHSGHVLDTSDTAYRQELIEHERHLHIVRASGIVQVALEQKIEEERTKSSGFETMHQNPFIRALGYVCGEVLKIGPEYTAIISSSRSEQEWVSSFEDDRIAPWALTQLRFMHDKYFTKIIEYGDKELSRIRKIASSKVIGWGFKEKRPHHHSKLEDIKGDGHDGMQSDSTGQMMCLFTNNKIGLVPSITKPGDVLVRFADCDAAMVMRPRTEGKQTSLILIGRVDIYGDAPECKELYSRSGNLSQTYAGGRSSMGAIYVDFDFNTLQLITASITIK
ncbi:heterokaryon incompatibility protein-domain-containing protein [Hypoxylon sp. FL1150]|nr:heterokaryon incompatibility protein-domain-containing protein [Hypoxylon sp. FL1150]